MANGQPQQQMYYPPTYTYPKQEEGDVTNVIIGLLVGVGIGIAGYYAYIKYIKPALGIAKINNVRVMSVVPSDQLVM